MSYDKIPSVCVFTLHSVQLSTSSQDSFQVEWKRGDIFGTTERSIPGEDGVVVFEKQGRIPVTIYVDKRTGSVRAKLVKFSFFVWRQSKRKTFGKAEVDVGTYFRVEAATTATIEIESPHSEKPKMIISFATTPVKVAPGQKPPSEDDMTSVADAMQLVTDQNDDWDVSEAVVGESKAKLEAFLTERREKQEKQFQLNAMRRTATPPTRAPQPRRERLQRMDLKQQNVMPSLSSFMAEPAVPAAAPKLRRKETAGGDLSLLTKVYQGPAEPTPAATVVSAGPLLRSVLGKAWSTSPIDPVSVPLAVSAILAACVSTRLFEAGEAANSVIDDFVKDFEVAQIVAGESLSDAWLVALSLLNCLRHGPRIPKEGAQYMIEKVLQAVRKRFSTFIESFLPALLAIGEQLLEADDPASPSVRLADGLANAFRSFCFPGKLEDLCRRHLLTAFDGQLISLIYAVPGRCTLGKAIRWNTAITICDMDRHISLPLFREAAMVVQGGMVLCSEPSVKDEMAPQLPPAVVLKILGAQTPDDFCPIANDIGAFAEYFKIKPGDQGAVDISYKGDFEALDDILSHDWDGKRFRPDQIVGFEYLSDYLA
jgi:hypothetical protein